jgi:hypothetical protein
VSPSGAAGTILRGGGTDLRSGRAEVYSVSGASTDSGNSFEGMEGRPAGMGGDREPVENPVMKIFEIG